MKGSDLRPRRWAGSLRTRLIAFLTIALLPLGVIAVLQTVQVMNEADRLIERDLLSRTARAASEQGAVLRRGFGAAEALGASAVGIGDDPDLCSAIMADFVERQPTFVFAGFINADGMMTCNSAGATIDYAGQAQWDAFVADPRRMLEATPSGDASQAPVFIIFSPIFDDTGTLLGGQALSIPHDLAQTLLNSEVEDVELALVAPDGAILSSSTGMDDLLAFERLNVVPTDMSIPPSGVVLRTRTRVDNLRQPVSVVPLVPGQVYVVGLWTAADSALRFSMAGRTVPLFPLLMWVASLLVAYITVNNLVLRHLTRLRQRMELYRAGGALPEFRLHADAPDEIREIADSYNDLLMRVATDQAELEDTVREKELLLREVHHRVKNNLQLIASILNMQMRGIKDPGAKAVLARVQDRVMSLSSIHRALYTDTKLDAVRVDTLLDGIIDSVSDIALPGARRVEVQRTASAVSLEPDQAVPLLLLATEALTNAAKYVGTPGAGPPEIAVRLNEAGRDKVVFQVRNTRGAETDKAFAEDAEADGSGLGARLIEAFASQMGGSVEVEVTDHHYDLIATFRNAIAAQTQDDQ